MQWEFTAQDVVKGTVDYGIESFRRDLEAEIRLNLPDLDPGTLQRIHALVYDLLYWLATGKEFDEFVARFGSSGFTPLFLESIRGRSAGDVEMLGAILQRRIMDQVERGNTLERAIDEVSRAHETLLAAAANSPGFPS